MKIIQKILNKLTSLSKVTKITIISITIFIIAILSLYQTFATSSTMSELASGDYNININSSSTIEIPNSSSKIVYFKLKNTNKGTINYGIAYSGTNITVKECESSSSESTGKINENQTKFIKLYIENTDTTSTSQRKVSIISVLGYENGGDLIVPEDYTLVTEKYSDTTSEGLAKYIRNKYNTSSKETVTNNNIKYSYSEAESLMRDIDNNIRYYGTDPNNYIYFNCEEYPNTNCELWRIVGVFDGKVKIVRNESIGTMAWDYDKNITTSQTSYDNNWLTSTLNTTLNSSYYNGEGKIVSYYKITGDQSSSIDMTEVGIKNDLTREMISNSDFYVRGTNTTALFPDIIYNMERKNGTTLYNASTITGNIAILYVSDYLYATNLKVTECDLSSDSYDASACFKNNWLAGFGWLIMPNIDNNTEAWDVNSGTPVNNRPTYTGLDVHPTLYLEATIDMKGGEGTSDNPYLIDLSSPTKADTYTIKYNLNGGTGTIASQTKQAGKSITLSTIIPEREGYDFLGWAKTSTATQATYTSGETFTEDANITLYAVWSLSEEVVTYNITVIRRVAGETTTLITKEVAKGEKFTYTYTAYNSLIYVFTSISCDNDQIGYRETNNVTTKETLIIDEVTASATCYINYDKQGTVTS